MMRFIKVNTICSGVGGAHLAIFTLMFSPDDIINSRQIRFQEHSGELGCLSKSHLSI